MKQLKDAVWHALVSSIKALQNSAKMFNAFDLTSQFSSMQSAVVFASREASELKLRVCKVPGPAKYARRKAKAHPGEIVVGAIDLPVWKELV